ncbi:MAG: hypothetical protein ABR905_14475 [Terracidiphilus sp.]
MLGLASCWISLNMLRESFPKSAAGVSLFISTNWTVTLSAALGAMLWAVATWQRLFQIALSNWAATFSTIYLAGIWGYLLRYRIGLPLALGLFLVAPLPLAVLKDGVERRKVSSEDPQVSLME